MNPGAGTEVNDMISAADGLFVMLDHHHRVAEIAEVKKGIQQALVVTLMESDGGAHVQMYITPTSPDPI